MCNFYIRQIALTGDTVREAIVDLDKGLNIVYGLSNTGKNYFIECFSFMFGGSAKSFHVDQNTGYNCMKMLISTSNGDIHLSRYFKENKIYVNSLHPDIASGKYSMSKGKKNIGSLWLYLMGIKHPTTIIKNGDFARSPLTLRTFMHTFLLKEDNLTRNNSILSPGSGFSKTTALSALLFLMTENALIHYDTPEDKKIKRSKKSAVSEYIKRYLSQLVADKNKLGSIQPASVYNIHMKMTGIMDEIENTEGTLTSSIAESRRLAQEIYTVNDQLAEANMLNNRYQILTGQYQSDINRLIFIVEGSLHKTDFIGTPDHPIYNDNFEEIDAESYAEAASSELSKIILQYNDLKDAERDLIHEIEQLNNIHSSLQQEREMIERSINSDLRPKVQKLRDSLKEYRSAIRVDVESSMIHSFEYNMQSDLERLHSERIMDEKYIPKEHFSPEVIGSIDNILSNILNACHFDNYSSSYFNMNTFDVVVNQKHKANYSKGYRAFLNTVVALTFMEYLSVFGAFSPRMFIMDSSILSLEEKDGEQVSSIMNKSLFQYFINNQEKSQMIIIENKIPELDYTNANLIDLTKNTEFSSLDYSKLNR